MDLDNMICIHMICMFIHMIRTICLYNFIHMICRFTVIFNLHIHFLKHIYICRI